MNKITPRIHLTPKDRQILILPATAVAVLFNLFNLLQATNSSFLSEQSNNITLVGALSIGYIALLFFLVLPALENYAWLNWIIVIINGLTVGALYAVPYQQSFLPDVLSTIVIVVTAILAGRVPTYIYICLNLVVRIALLEKAPVFTRQYLVELMSLPLIGVVITETIALLQNAIQTHVKRLETLNKVARNLSTSLETPQVLSLLSSAIQNSFRADTYYMGILRGDKLRLELFYDDGEFFPKQDICLENTLAGWAIKNRQPLLIRNFDREASRLGIESVIVGKPKGSSSWMGAPILSGGDLLGLVAVACYKKKAFNQADLELLQNIAQQAGLAIDNTYHHAEVEYQSHVDSLTGVYNHGYFLQLLKEEAEKAVTEHNQLSLIMLDIDHFKHYNDQYGHLAGDEILSLLTRNIRSIIHSTDIVGRWGGEEFAIVLPNTTSQQATQVAERIRKSMNTFIISRNHTGQIPSPTVSQGIAVFPDEMDEMYALIDLADKRLFAAKDRGRNQIESAPEELIPVSILG
jgi:diguanylate cyclase (GGDEF)-like protein